MVARAAAAGIALGVVGLVLALASGTFYAGCTSAPSGSPGACDGFVIGLVIGILFAIAGIAVAASASRTYTFVTPAANPAVPPPLATPVVIQQNVVRVRCRYCGALSDPVQGKCANCGAPL